MKPHYLQKNIKKNRMSGVEYNTWKVADLKAQLKAKVTKTVVFFVI